MNAKILILFFLITSNYSYSQCFSPVNLSSSNINYYNVNINWNTASNVYNYRVRYKEIGSSSWLFINNINSTSNTQLLVNLTPITNYIWQIKSYCDSININTSSWSVTDTFTTITNNCPNTNLLFTTNINYNNALANWNTVSGADRYRLRYKILGTSNWSNLGPIYHPTDSITIPLLQQNTSYEWQVLTYHDTSTLLASLWSLSDTFTTTNFVAASFNPIITNTISSLQCSTKVDLYLNVSQATNEPDIGTSTITSDGGFFDINSINIGDSIGYASLTTGTQTISATLKPGVILSQNYATINSYDDSGSLIGFFVISNENGGVKITSTTPNDGNNYTSGYLSELCISNLFVTPSIAGPLTFFSDINSELNNQVYMSETIQIWCSTSTIFDSEKPKKIKGIYTVSGRKTSIKNNEILFFIYEDSTIKKRLLLK